MATWQWSVQQRKYRKRTRRRAMHAYLYCGSQEVGKNPRRITQMIEEATRGD